MDSPTKGKYNFYTNSAKIKSAEKTRGLRVVYSNGAMPPVNFDPGTGKKMTPLLIDFGIAFFRPLKMDHRCMDDIVRGGAIPLRRRHIYYCSGFGFDVVLHEEKAALAM